jgi:hypothetical protein
MAQYYQKINTIWKRDERNKIILGDYAMPEIEYLKDNIWEVTEKIDGTNMSFEIMFEQDGTIKDWNIHGKTEQANIPANLLNEMNRLYNLMIEDDKLSNTFRLEKTNPETNKVEVTYPYKVTIFGEGYGAKIQGGGRYSATPKFIVFDVMIQSTENGEPMYLLRKNVEDICSKLSLDIVHCYGEVCLYTICDIIETIAKKVYTSNNINNIKKSDYNDDYIQEYMFSHSAEDENLVIEGFVVKSPLGLKTRLGKNIVFKVKVKDYLDLIKESNKCRK